MAWQVQPLGSHDRSSFSCGQQLLDQWFRQQAGQYQRRDLARTFVTLRDDEIAGFYSLASHAVAFEDLSTAEAKGLPKIALPVVLLGRLAVDKRYQGQGLGAFLLIDALLRAKALADQLGIRAVEVHAIDDQARAFYIKFGFRSLADDTLHMYLPMHEIRQISVD